MVRIPQLAIRGPYSVVSSWCYPVRGYRRHTSKAPRPLEYGSIEFILQLRRNVAISRIVNAVMVVVTSPFHSSTGFWRLQGRKRGIHLGTFAQNSS